MERKQAKKTGPKGVPAAEETKEINAGKETEPEETKRKKLERQIAILFVVLVLVLGSFLLIYTLAKPKPYFKYQNMTVWKVQLEGSRMFFYSIPLSIMAGNMNYQENVVLRNDPRTIENISLNLNKNLFLATRMIITMEPEVKATALVAANELQKFSDNMKIPASVAFTDSAGREVAVANCSDATEDKRVILFRLTNETKVYSEQNCIIVEASDYDNLIKASDKLVVEWILSRWR